MRIILSYHAKKRMIERDIKLQDIEETIEIPNYTVSKGNKKEAYKKIKDKTLKVIYSEGNKYIKVITLMWK
jgi:DNA-binding Xre family transcriptional regulator